MPNPADNSIEELHKLCFNFLWKGLPDKIKRSQVVQDYNMEVLKLLISEIIKHQ